MPVWKINKIKTLLSAFFNFLLFLHSAQIHSFILNFWSWYQPIRIRAMSFTKLKVISHNLCKALGIPLYCTFTEIRLLFIANIRTRIKWFLNSSGSIWQGQLNGKAGVGGGGGWGWGERRQFTGENSGRTITLIDLKTDYQTWVGKLQFFWYIDFVISDFSTFRITKQSFK